MIWLGIFAGFSAAAIALVASQVPEDRLGYSLGWLSTGQLVGSLVGPAYGLLVEQAGYRPRFTTVEAFDDFARTLRQVIRIRQPQRAVGFDARRGFDGLRVIEQRQDFGESAEGHHDRDQHREQARVLLEFFPVLVFEAHGSKPSPATVLESGRAPAPESSRALESGWA